MTRQRQCYGRHLDSIQAFLSHHHCRRYLEAVIVADKEASYLALSHSDHRLATCLANQSHHQLHSQMSGQVCTCTVTPLLLAPEASLIMACRPPVHGLQVATLGLKMGAVARLLYLLYH